MTVTSLLATGWSFALVVAAVTPAASPGASQSPKAGDFREPAPWLSSNWSSRIEISVDPASIPSGEALEGFPLLVALDGARAAEVFTNARPDGLDLVFTNTDGVTVLPHEIVEYDPGFERAELWVYADEISADRDRFYLYFGNPDTINALPYGASWDSSYLAVYHFQDNPADGTLGDSTWRRSNGSARNGWTESDVASGPIGQSWKFNGTSHWIDGDAISSPDSTFTFSAWFGLHNLQGSWGDFAFQTQGGWHLSAKRNQTQRAPDYAGPAGFLRWDPIPLPDTLLHQCVWVMDGVADTVRFFFDGIEQDYNARYAPNPPHRVYSGLPITGNVGIASPMYGNLQDLVTGIVDEFTIYQGTRSPEWIRFAFENQSPGSSLLELQLEHSTSHTPTVAFHERLLRVAPNPFSSRTSIHALLEDPSHLRSDLVISVFDVLGRRVRTFHLPTNQSLTIDWDGSGSDGRELPNGQYVLWFQSAGRTSSTRVVIFR